jgi:hypothetical protein
MPANPLRRRGKLADAAKLAAADAALSYARDRLTPGSRKQRGRGRGKVLLIGGALVAVGAAGLVKRNRVAGFLGAGQSVPEPPQPATSPTPAPTPTPTPTPATPAPAVAIPATPDTPSTPETPAAGDPAEREATQAAEEAAPAPEEGKEDDGPGWQTWSGISSKP